MSRDVLIYDRRDPLFGMERQEVLDHLRASLSGRVQAAYLYGSFARGETHAGSDIDLILVTETAALFPERGGDFADLRDRLPSIEILVYTPAEFAALTADPGPGFWQSVCRDLHRLV